MGSINRICTGRPLKSACSTVNQVGVDLEPLFGLIFRWWQHNSTRSTSVLYDACDRYLRPYVGAQEWHAILADYDGSSIVDYLPPYTAAFAAAYVRGSLLEDGASGEEAMAKSVAVFLQVMKLSESGLAHLASTCRPMACKRAMGRRLS